MFEWNNERKNEWKNVWEIQKRCNFLQISGKVEFQLAVILIFEPNTTPKETMCLSLTKSLSSKKIEMHFLRRLLDEWHYDMNSIKIILTATICRQEKACGWWVYSMIKLRVDPPTDWNKSEICGCFCNDDTPICWVWLTDHKAYYTYTCTHFYNSLRYLPSAIITTFCMLSLKRLDTHSRYILV